MPYPAALTDEVARNASAGAALAMMEEALARRSGAEQGAFWHAIDLAYVARKAPPQAVAPSPSPTASREDVHAPPLPAP